MKKYTNGDIQIWYKVIQGMPHPSFRSSKERKDLGIAFRTASAPIGYLPFYDQADFDLSGEVSMKETVVSYIPASDTASPYCRLIIQASEDPEFTRPIDGEASIQREVYRDRLKFALSVASDFYVDAIMMAIGSPAVTSVMKSLIQAPVKRFVLSKAVSSSVKAYLKNEYRVDVDRILEQAK